jgi:hypothetical protein
METLLWLAWATANVLTLNVFAAPHQGNGSTASVLIGVEADRATGLDLRYEINGAVVRTVSAGAARMLTRHPLPPGNHQLVIHATDRATGRTASIASAVEVPDLTPGLSRLAMSEALLTASHVTGPTITDVEDDGALSVLGLPPTPRRTFSRDEQLEVHAEFYEQPAQLEFDTQLTVTTRLLAEDGSVVFDTKDTGSSEDLGGNRWGYAHSTLVPIAALEPGHYVVQVIGETLYDGPASAARSIPITVVATPSANNR